MEIFRKNARNLKIGTRIFFMRTACLWGQISLLFQNILVQSEKNLKKKGSPK